MGELLTQLIGAIAGAIDAVFGPPLRAVFHPIDAFVGQFYMPTARIVAVAFFAATAVWVFVGLKEAYVNLEAPAKKLRYDLRLWTIAAMLPHLVVYLFL